MVLTLVIGTTSLFANNVEGTKELSKIIRNQIVSLLQALDFIIENEALVTITITFSQQGKIVILNVDTRDKNILNYVRKNLNYKKVDSPGERDKIYTMPLKVTSS